MPVLRIDRPSGFSRKKKLPTEDISRPQSAAYTGTATLNVVEKRTF
jgi:hypothetical protein